MKKWHVALICLMVLGLVFAGCVKPDSPSGVIKQYIAALEKGDAKTIERLSTPQTAELVLQHLDKARGFTTAKGKIKNIEETIDGDIAKVTVNYKKPGSDTFTLVKIDGEWKVSIGK